MQINKDNSIQYFCFIKMCQTLKKRRQRSVERLGFSFFGSDKHCFMKNLVGASREKKTTTISVVLTIFAHTKIRQNSPG